MTPIRRRAIVALTTLVLVGACSSDADESSSGDAERGGTAADAGDAADVQPPPFIADVRGAIAAVEAELGRGQQFFEVTANEQFTNVFVAVDDGTAAIAYAYIDGALQPPAPRQEGASGETFGADEVDFADTRILSGVSAELTDSEVDALSVYGNASGVTYVLAASSPAGGFLDIVVGPDGAIFSVDPV